MPTAKKKRAKKGSKKAAKKSSAGKLYKCKIKGSKGGFKMKRRGKKAPKSAKVFGKRKALVCKKA